MQINLNSSKPWRPLVFVLLSTFVISVAGGATLLWQTQQQRSTNAEEGSIVGEPTLPAETVEAILKRMGSPMVGTGKIIEQAAREAHIDNAFALAVWWAETNAGAAGVGLVDRNPGAIRGSPNYPAAWDGYTVYPTYADAIIDWFTILKNRYISRGLTTVYSISYPYVGTSGAERWAAKVTTYMLRYRSEAPPPIKPAQESHSSPADTYRPGQGHLQKIVDEESPGQQPAVPAQTTDASPSLLQQYWLPSGLALLVVALCAYWFLRRMSQPSRSDLFPSTEPLTGEQNEPQLPAIYVHEFSPVLAQEMPPLVSWLQTQKEARPEEPISPVNGGLLKRYSQSDARPRRIVLMRPEVAEEPITVPELPVIQSEEPVRVGGTFLSIPRRTTLVAQPVRTGGLLQRYGALPSEQRT